MGTMLQKSSLKVGERPEVLNITNPDSVREIHKKYIDSGSEIIYTNTFGANRKKLENSGYSVDEIIFAAVENAKSVSKTNTKISLDIGPIGEMLEPMGTLSFEEAYDIFSEQVVAGVKSGVDQFSLETMTDLYEVKAGILAIKENSELPVFVTMSFEKDMRTFTGCTIESFIVTAEGLGVDAIGINCSLGPTEILPIIKRASELTELPLIVKANAGLPDINDKYDLGTEKFAKEMAKIANLGVKYLGGCCGTDDRYIEKLSLELGAIKYKERKVLRKSMVCSANEFLEIDGFTMIGERINPTGKPFLQNALLKGNVDPIVVEAIKQSEEGADLLDVNIGFPEVDEVGMMKKSIVAIQSVLNTPLQIDSSNIDVIETGLRAYNGKPIVNSVNGRATSLKKVLPLVKKYGASVIGLTLDDDGIPETPHGRLKIAEKIMKDALRIGIKKEDIFIDCLALTISSDSNSAITSIETIKLVKERLGLKTVLGISNISFGLPNRELINANYLMKAIDAGLDLAIVNTGSKLLMDSILAENLLKGNNVDYFIEKFSDNKPNKLDAQFEISLEYAITNGLKEDVVRIIDNLAETEAPMDIINQRLIPILDEIGDRYERGIIFLPQLIKSAETAQIGFDILKLSLGINSNGGSKGKIILATVEGDVHDIGKNIAKVVLENYGYEIYDLGRDVSIEEIVENAERLDIKLIGLSALMTTTLNNMAKTIEAIKALDVDIKIMVGGAVLTEDYSKVIGADYYLKDVKSNVEVAREIFID
ncbi:MAG: dihydropteroate synthase [Tissierellia bacterium]|nr:dihydropteroate synthase [Tissierellia bacterium]